MEVIMSLYLFHCPGPDKILCNFCKKIKFPFKFNLKFSLLMNLNKKKSKNYNLNDISIISSLYLLYINVLTLRISLLLCQAQINCSLFSKKFSPIRNILKSQFVSVKYQICSIFIFHSNFSVKGFIIMCKYGK